MNNRLVKEIVSNYKSEVMYPFNEVMSLIGFEALCVIIEEFGGNTIYIPTKRRVFSNCFEQQIIKEFNGKNYKALSKKYEVNERTIRNLINKNKFN